MGRRVIHDLMDIFWEGALTGSKAKKGFSRKIYDLTSQNYRVVYEEAKKRYEGLLGEYNRQVWKKDAEKLSAKLSALNEKIGGLPS